VASDASPEAYRLTKHLILLYRCRLEGKRDTIDQVRYWEIIADNLSKAGWSWGCVSAVDCNGRTIWIADAHRDDGKRFVVRADEKLTAFLERESEITQEKSSILLGSP
jgi:hypothetical protein